MNGAGVVIGVVAIGGAIFLYFKSKADQAAALAAAQAAPGPGFLGKAENTLKSVFSKKTLTALESIPKTAVGVPLSAVGSAASGVSHVASSIVGGIKGIF